MTSLSRLLIPRVVDDAQVNCPEGEQLCETDGPRATPTCSFRGVCGLEAVGPTEQSDYYYDYYYYDASYEYTEVDAVDLGPSISLLGSDTVNIPVGTVYQFCPANREVREGEICEQGVQATDPEEGKLTSRVVITCGPPDSTVQIPLSGRTLAPCQIDTSTPGVHELQFSVSDSNPENDAVSVWRTLRVEPMCVILTGQAGSVACKDGVSCSIDGTCVADLDSTAALDVAEIINHPPHVTLNGAAVVEIKQYSSYRLCSRLNASELAENPVCDLGAVAEDIEDGDLTAALLVCAQSDCKKIGNCNSYLLRNTGINFKADAETGCGVNTNSPIGTKWELVFTVYDSVGWKDTATRTISIINPCGKGSSLNYCPDADGTYICVDVTCEQYNSIILGLAEEEEEAINEPPALSLIGDASIRVSYGVASGASVFLMPCASVQQQQGCGATAEDPEDGDVSGQIIIRQICPSSDPDCPKCSPTQVTLGACVPGKYGYQYSVADSGDLEVIALRVVTIEEVANMEISISFGGGAEFQSSIDAPGSPIVPILAASVASLVQKLSNLLTPPSAVSIVNTAILDSGLVDVSFNIRMTYSGTVSSAASRRRLQQFMLDFSAIVRAVSETIVEAVQSGQLEEEIAKKTEEMAVEGFETPTVGDATLPVVDVVTPQVDELAGFFADLFGGIDVWMNNMAETRYRLESVTREYTSAVAVSGTLNLVAHGRISDAYRSLMDYATIVLLMNEQTASQVAAKMGKNGFSEVLSNSIAELAGDYFDVDNEQKVYLKDLVTSPEFLSALVVPGEDGVVCIPGLDENCNATMCHAVLTDGEYERSSQIKYTPKKSLQELLKESLQQRRKLQSQRVSGDAFKDDKRWGGYPLTSMSDSLMEARDLVTNTRGLAAMPKHMGEKDGNTVIGGVLLHLTRKVRRATKCH